MLVAGQTALSKYLPQHWPEEKYFEITTTKWSYRPIQNMFRLISSVCPHSRCRVSANQPLPISMYLHPKDHKALTANTCSPLLRRRGALHYQPKASVNQPVCRPTTNTTLTNILAQKRTKKAHQVISMQVRRFAAANVC